MLIIFLSFCSNLCIFKCMKLVFILYGSVPYKPRSHQAKYVIRFSGISGHHFIMSCICRFCLHQFCFGVFSARNISNSFLYTLSGKKCD